MPEKEGMSCAWDIAAQVSKRRVNLSDSAVPF